MDFISFLVQAGIAVGVVVGAVYLWSRVKDVFGDQEIPARKPVRKSPKKPSRPAPSPKANAYSSSLPNVLGTAGGLSSFSSRSNEVGSNGEIMTARVLESLAADDKNLLIAHGMKFKPRSSSKADMDHLAAKGSKVILIDSKYYSARNGSWSLKKDRQGDLNLVSGDRSYKNSIDDSMDIYRKYLGKGAQVYGFIVMHNASVNSRQNSANGVTLISGTDLPRAIKSILKGTRTPSKYYGKIEAALLKK